MRTTVDRVLLAVALLAASGTAVSVSAQSQSTSRGPAPAGQTPAAQAPQVRKLTSDDAVRLALENNLGIRIARYDPQLEDLNILGARANWAPTFTTTFQQTSSEQPPNSLLSGATSNVTQGQFTGTTGITQSLRHGTRYEIGWDANRSTSNNFFSSFNPQLRTNFSLSVTQPLLRGWDIDNIRQQLETSLKNREISDIDVRETLAQTTRTVRRAYMDLAYSIANLQVQRQSLDLARESLRNTRSRIEIGTTPPIDEVADQAEVATREEAVIVAEAAIAQAEDTLRALIFDSKSPDFWTIRIEATDLPPFVPLTLDVDTIVRTALERRTDLQRSRKQVEVADVGVRFYRNQTLPEITASFDYGLTALGGTQVQRAQTSNPLIPGDIISETSHRFFPVLGDLFGFNAPRWTWGLNISYPLGTSAADANLARTRLQQTQLQQQIAQQQLNITTQVRQTARSVSTNQQRVQTSRVSRELAERRLEAEQRKFTAGTSTNFFVQQAQRDLAVARNNELRAILDYNQSIVDLETVQEVPLAGGGATAAPTGQ
jgi:outer membrane protein